MNRRDLVRNGVSAAMGAGLLRATAEAQAAASGSGREYYLIRSYHIQQGPTFAAAANKYFSGALLPALTRMGMGPVGVFSLTYGGGTPQTCVVVPGKDVRALAMIDLSLQSDATFLKDAAGYWDAAATAPPFERVDSQLSVAFEGFPKLVVPTKEQRIMQLRTYESPTYAAYQRKVEMFHHGEFRIFSEAGAKSVFYGENLIGARLPSLTYMLTFPDLAAMDAAWKKFLTHPDWEKLSHDPRYASEPTVSHIDNLVMTPTAYSQI